MYVVRIIYNCILSHVTPQDVWLISFPRKNVSRMHYNFVFMVQHMMLCNFPSQDQLFLVLSAISCSWYSTWCLLNLLGNKSFLAYFVFMLQHMLFVEFPSRDYTFLTYTAATYSWWSLWCLLKFPPHACCALWTSSSSSLIKVDLKIRYENMRIYIVIITTFQTLLLRRLHISYPASAAHAQFRCASPRF